MSQKLSSAERRSCLKLQSKFSSVTLLVLGWLFAGLAFQNISAAADLGKLSSTGRQATGGTSLSGPILGFVLDQELNRVYPVLGLPGAATLGASVFPAAGTQAIAYSASGKILVAVQGDGTRLEVVRYGASDSDSSVIELPAPTRLLAVSAHGKKAAVVDADDVLWLVDELLSAKPVVERLGQLVEPVASLRVSDAGTVATFGGSISLWSRGSAGIYVPLPAGRYVGVWVPGKEVLLLAESSTGELWQVEPAGSALVSHAGQLALQSGVQIIDLGISAGDSRVSALLSDGKILSYDLASRAVATTVECQCQPVRLRRLLGQNTFLLETAADGMPRIFDGEQIPPRLFLVPRHMPRIQRQLQRLSR